MRTSQLQRGEINVKARFQLFAVPGISAEKLFVVSAAFVPVRQQRAREVEAFAVPTLRNHVELTTDLFFINLLGLMGIRYVEDTALAIAEAIDEQGFVISADADVHQQHTAFDIADGRNFLR